jgi:hypothetical protein
VLQADPAEYANLFPNFELALEAEKLAAARYSVVKLASSFPMHEQNPLADPLAAVTATADSVRVASPPSPTSRVAPLPPLPPLELRLSHLSHLSSCASPTSPTSRVAPLPPLPPLPPLELRLPITRNRAPGGANSEEASFSKKDPLS